MANNLVFMTAEMAEQMLEGFSCRRTALEVGDILSDKGGVLVEEYHGRFGDGYKVHFHSEINTGLHVVGYYVK